MARGFTPDGSGYVIVFDGETAAPAAAELTEHLDPRASFLELGMIVCRDTPDLEEVGVASVLIRPPGTLQDHDLLFASLLPVVRDMHTRSGLWQQATTDSEAWRVDEADASLAQWLDSLGVPLGKVPLLGSGVSHFDSRWIAAHLPRLASRVTYWTVDAGVIRRALELARRDDLVDKVGDVDAKNHRALDDARLHAAELRRYLRLLAAIPVADAPIAPPAAQESVPA